MDWQLDVNCIIIIFMNLCGMLQAASGLAPSIRHHYANNHFTDYR